MADLKTKTLSNLETITSIDDNDKVLIERGGDIIKVNASSVKSQDLDSLDEFSNFDESDKFLVERDGEMIRIDQDAVKTPDLGSLETVNSLGDGDKILVNVNGEMKQVNGGEIGGQEVFMVNYYIKRRLIISNYNDPPLPYSYDSDKTFNEIMEAVDDGKYVIAHLLTEIRDSDDNLVEQYENFIPLSGFDGFDLYYINSEIELDHSYSEKIYLYMIFNDYNIEYYKDSNNNIVSPFSYDYVLSLSQDRNPKFVFESSIYDLVSYDNDIIKLQNVEYDFTKCEVTVSIIEHNSANEISTNKQTFSLSPVITEATA